MNNHEGFDSLRFVMNFKQMSKHSSFRKLFPVGVNDILRVGGRLARADLPVDTKFPILLPIQSSVTSLNISC